MVSSTIRDEIDNSWCCYILVVVVEWEKRYELMMFIYCLYKCFIYQLKLATDRNKHWTGKTGKWKNEQYNQVNNNERRWLCDECDRVELIDFIGFNPTFSHCVSFFLTSKLCMFPNIYLMSSSSNHIFSSSQM